MRPPAVAAAPTEAGERPAGSGEVAVERPNPLPRGDSSLWLAEKGLEKAVLVPRPTAGDGCCCGWGLAAAPPLPPPLEAAFAAATEAGVTTAPPPHV